MDEDRLASLMAELAFAAAVVPIQLPARIGEGDRYELQELVSRSDRSHVYLAVDRLFEHEGHDAKVIVKVTGIAERGVLEALTARHINSPFVVRVLDRGRLASGEHFLVLEHEPLGDLGMQRLPWPPKKAALFVAQLASVVQAAHSAGLVHCDLKPGNVLVTDHGEPRLTDFDLSNKVVDPGITGPRGNRAFAAPEQFRGEDSACSPRADIYALGGLLYYALSGRMPNGDTPESIESLHAGQRTRDAMDAPAGLREIVNRALAPVPIDRYATAEQMTSDLHAWLELRPLPSKKSSAFTHTTMWCRRHPTRAVLAVTLAAAVIGGVIGAMAWRSAENARKLQVAVEAHALAQREVTALKNRLATQVESMATGLRFMMDTGSPEKLSTGLTLLQQLERVPFDLQDKRVSTSQQQRELLLAMLQRSDNSGQSSHFDAQVARLMLAMIELRDGRPEAALQLSEETERRWNGRLVTGEAVEIAQRFTQITSRAFVELQSGSLSPGTTAALQDLRRDVAREPSRPSMLWVIDRALSGTPINAVAKSAPE